MTKAISQLVDIPNTTQAIRTLKANDIYKRLEKPAYASPKIVIGVVTSVLGNGEGDLAVTALEFEQGYNATNAVQKVYSADDTLTLFPITTEEFVLNVDALKQGARDQLRKNQEEVRRQQVVVEIIEGLEAGTFGVQEAEVGDPVDDDSDL